LKKKKTRRIVGLCRICKELLMEEIEGNLYEGETWIRRENVMVCRHHKGVMELIAVEKQNKNGEIG